MERYAAVIGTREPDQNQILMAQESLKWLNAKNVIVRTGGAIGVDHLAMQFAARLEVVLPWKSYNKEIIPAHAKVIVADERVHSVWFESVDKYHPYPQNLTRGARALHARNYGIVEGCQLVIAFPNEQGEGGTGQGIRIAKALGIPLIEHRRGRTVVKRLV